MPKKPPPPNLSEMTHVEKDTLILALLERLAALENKVNKDSHNSSKPPSSDGLQRRPKSLKPKSSANVGGQFEHPGTTLKKSLAVDHTVVHPLPIACDVCGAFLAGQESTLENETRQVIDLPPIRFEVTEHRIMRAQCTCGAQHCSAFPEEVRSAVQYGPGIRAASVYFTQYQQLPYKRCADAFRDLFGIKISAGSMVNFTRRAAYKLKPVVAAIAQAIIQAPVAHYDETGMRVGKRLTWLHSLDGIPYVVWTSRQPRREGDERLRYFAALPWRCSTRWMVLLSPIFLPSRFVQRASSARVAVYIRVHPAAMGARHDALAVRRQRRNGGR